MLINILLWFYRKLTLSEFKPTRNQWFFSIIIAAGVGAGLVDAAKWGINKITESKFELEIVDIWCRHGKCNLTIKNKGDEVGVITAFHFDDESHRYEEFETSHPIVSPNTKYQDLLSPASVALVDKKSYVEVSVGTTEGYRPTKEVCVYSQKNKWCINSKQTQDILTKENHNKLNQSDS